MQKTIRIAYVSNAAIPSNRANSISIMKFCSALATNGHEVFLIHPYAPWFEEKTESNPFEFYGIPKNFQIIKIAWFPWCNKMHKGILKPIAFLIKTILYPLLASLAAARLRPDMIYTRYLPSSFWAAFFMNIPTIYEHHDFFHEIPFFSRKMLPLMIRKGCLKRIVVISKPLADDYRKRLSSSLDPQHIIVAPDGADENLAQPDKTLLQGSFSFNVGFAGHIYPGRGMEIIAKLSEKMPDIAFHVIGGATQDVSHWKNKCSALKNIFFYGFVPPSKVPAYLKSMDILLAPYQRKVSTVAGIDSSNRMSPLKIFEYMASGKPFIASDLPVLYEVLDANATALLCSPDDIQEWQNAILKLKNDPEFAQKIANNALQKFTANYTWTARAKNILSSIEEKVTTTKIDCSIEI